MAGFVHMFSNLTDHVFGYRHQPRIANVWDRASSRTAHLFDKANVNDKSHGITKTEEKEKTTEAVEMPAAAELPVDEAMPTGDAGVTPALRSESASVETAAVEGEDEPGVTAPDENSEAVVDVVT